MKLYLAGPMRKHKDDKGNWYNFPTFFIAAALLRMKGHIVVSPAEMDIEDGAAWWSPEDGRIVLAQSFTMQDAMRRDIRALSDPSMEAIVLLPEFEDSTGANNELDGARLFGLKEFTYEGDGEICEMGSPLEVVKGASG